MNYFEKLNGINVSDKTEKKNGLTYLSWAWALTEVLKVCPEMVFEVKKFNGLPYVYDTETGYMVFTDVTVDGITREMWLPVMDGANKSMKAELYTYKDRWNKEKTVEAATMFDINKTIMRCLTKNLAMFGLGLYIYAGEDLPEADNQADMPDKEKVDTSQKITQAHIDYINNAMKSTGGDVSGFLTYMEIDKIEDMTLGEFMSKGKPAIEKKLKAKK